MTPGTILHIDRLRRERRDILMTYVNAQDDLSKKQAEAKIRVISKQLRNLTGNTIY